jgi:hypothetical protein
MERSSATTAAADASGAVMECLSKLKSAAGGGDREKNTGEFIGECYFNVDLKLLKSLKIIRSPYYILKHHPQMVNTVIYII